jgi:hypothetical protein
MPKHETEKQRRWSFAAEARGELPKGTARRWAEESTREKDKERHVMAKRRKKKGHRICTKCGLRHARGACKVTRKTGKIWG